MRYAATFIAAKTDTVRDVGIVKETAAAFAEIIAYRVVALALFPCRADQPL